MYIIVYNIVLFVNSAEVEWMNVIHGTKISADLQTQQLQIKTDTATGSDSQISVYFYQGYQLAGGIEVQFSSPLKYWISYCSSKYRQFPTSPPETQEKIWGFLRTETGIRVECNGILVLEFDISISSCDSNYDSDIWTRNVRMFEFSSDTASRQYRLVNPGKMSP